ncbi:uncharacterized protein METZ01_LOCUS81758, partial [marine metagenome]
MKNGLCEKKERAQEDSNLRPTVPQT